MDYYWELSLKDGTKIQIPPKYVQGIRTKLKNREPIDTTRRTILYAEVDSFEQTLKTELGEQKLLEEAAQAFGEPLIRDREFADGTKDEAVSVKWVKKQVTQRDWDKYYSKGPGYQKLSWDAGIIVVAFRMPTHQINDEVQVCSDEELTKLTK